MGPSPEELFLVCCQTQNDKLQKQAVLVDISLMVRVDPKDNISAFACVSWLPHKYLHAEAYIYVQPGI